MDVQEAQESQQKVMEASGQNSEVHQGVERFGYVHAEGRPDIIEAFLDGDWACDDLDRKSASGGYLMVGGCRLHSHSRTTGQHALSSGESEIMSMSEVLKEAKLMQYNLEFCRMVLLPIVLHTDADVARAFCHKRGVGRMKHLDVRHSWLQEELERGNFKVKRVDRKFNASDMLTHSSSAEELRKFLPMIGCHTMIVKRKITMQSRRC